MKSSSKLLVSIFVGLFFGVISTGIFFGTVKSEVFTENPEFQMVVGFALALSLAVIFTIIAYLILPKND